jgi:hypothetical protein
MRYKTNQSQRGQADTTTYRVAQGLGVFSIVLGVFELICGRWLGRSLGLDGKEHIVRLYGGREILTGIAILVSKDPTPCVGTSCGGRTGHRYARVWLCARSGRWPRYRERLASRGRRHCR